MGSFEDPSARQAKRETDRQTNERKKGRVHGRERLIATVKADFISVAIRMISFSVNLQFFRINKSFVLYSNVFAVPPRGPVIVDESGREATATVGPFEEGSEPQISCEVRGGESISK